MIAIVVLFGLGILPPVPFGGTAVDDRGMTLAGVVVSVDGVSLVPTASDGSFGPASFSAGPHRLVATLGDLRSAEYGFHLYSRHPLLDYPLRLNLTLIRDHIEWVPEMAEPELPSSLRASPDTLEGCWGATENQLILTPLSEGLYEATFSSNGCMAHWSLQRKIRYSEGVLLANFPLRQYIGGDFQHLYVTEIAGVLYLVPSFSVPSNLKPQPGAPPYDLRRFFGPPLEKGRCR